MIIKQKPLLNRIPFYYGWVILLVSTLGLIMSIPGQTMGVSVFTETMIERYQLSRSQISVAYLLGTVISGMLLPWAGRIFDKIGSRSMFAIASGGLAFSLFILAHGSIWGQWLAAKTGLPLNVTTMAILCLAFLGVRHFGQGQMTVVSRTTLARWFDSYRGLVTAASGFMVSIGFGTAPILLNHLIQSYSWTTMLYQIIAALVIMMLIGSLFFRNSPEDCNIPMEAGFRRKKFQKEEIAEANMTLSEARRTLIFWLFNLGTSFHALLNTAIVFHIVAIGQAQGVDASTMFRIFLPMAVISTLSNLASGVFSDRINIIWLLVFMMVFSAIGAISCLFIGTEPGYYLTLLGLGISGGIFNCCSGVAWAKLFGRLHLGSINGFNMSWVVFGSAIGPFAFSFSYDNLGGFLPALLTAAVVCLALSAVALHYRFRPTFKQC